MPKDCIHGQNGKYGRHRVVEKVKQIMSQCPGHLRSELSNLENTIKEIFDYRVDFL